VNKDKHDISDVIVSLRVLVDELAEAKYQIKMAEFRSASVHTKFERALQDVEARLLAAAPTAKGE